MELHDKVIVVTGGTGALGGSVCDTLLEAGALLDVTYVKDADKARFDEEMAAHEWRYELHRTDVTSDAEVTKLFADVEKARQGKLDALVCIAGGFAAGPIETTSAETMRAQLALNFESVFLCAREAVGRMKRHGHGRIVTVGSRAAIDAPGGMSAYVASKAAVVALTRALAAEVRGTGITANCVLPSTIDTPANRASMPNADHSTWTAPEDIARVIKELLGDELAAVNGAILPV